MATSSTMAANTASLPLWSEIPRANWYTPLASVYREIRQVGEGTYGRVYEGVKRIGGGGQLVALKKVKISSEKNRSRGLPQNALREIRLLKNKCQHPNIVKLLDVAASVVPDSEQTPNDDMMDVETVEGGNSSSGFIYLVFEYVEHDLGGILASKYKFSDVAVASLTKQLLSGLAYLHDQNICHRDLKSSNLLITRNHHLRLADFGLARELYPEDPTVTYTNKVITLWYRPPEILLGDTHYSCVVDVWSVGCILLELIRATPLFPGVDEADQLKRIFEIVGLPTSQSWPGYSGLPNARWIDKFPHMAASSTIASYCDARAIDADVIALVSRMLELDPSRRCTARQALATRYCSMATDHASLPLLDIPEGTTLHEWEAKEEKRRLRQEAEASKAEALAKANAPVPPPHSVAAVFGGEGDVATGQEGVVAAISVPTTTAAQQHPLSSSVPYRVSDRRPSALPAGGEGHVRKRDDESHHRSSTARHDGHRRERSRSPPPHARNRQPGMMMQPPQNMATNRGDASQCVFVGNLPPHATERQVYSFFEICGPIERIKMGMTADGRECKGFCHIDFVDYRGAENAVGKQTKTWQGANRPLTVDWAVRKEGFKFGGGGGKHPQPPFNASSGHGIRNSGGSMGHDEGKKESMDEELASKVVTANVVVHRRPNATAASSAPPPSSTQDSSVTAAAAAARVNNNKMRRPPAAAPVVVGLPNTTRPAGGNSNHGGDGVVEHNGDGSSGGTDHPTTTTT